MFLALSIPSLTLILGLLLLLVIIWAIYRAVVKAFAGTITVPDVLYVILIIIICVVVGHAFGIPIPGIRI